MNSLLLHPRIPLIKFLASGKPTSHHLIRSKTARSTTGGLCLRGFLLMMKWLYPAFMGSHQPVLVPGLDQTVLVFSPVLKGNFLGGHQWSSPGASTLIFIKGPPEGLTCPWEDQSQMPRLGRWPWHLCLCGGEMPPAARKSSTSCSAKNKFSAAKGSSFRSPSSRKLRVQQPASWRLGRLGIFFFFSSTERKGRMGFFLFFFF